MRKRLFAILAFAVVAGMVAVAPQASACVKYILENENGGPVQLCVLTGEDANYCYYTCT